MANSAFFENILHSNKAINPIKSVGKFILGDTADVGIRGTINAMTTDGHKMGFKGAMKSAYSHNGLGESLNYKAIAGTYIGGAIAGRAISGGGIYRDRNGNADVAGIPFI